jgi:hypothetical protein
MSESRNLPSALNHEPFVRTPPGSTKATFRTYSLPAGERQITAIQKPSNGVGEIAHDFSKKTNCRTKA